MILTHRLLISYKAGATKKVISLSPRRSKNFGTFLSIPFRARTLSKSPVNRPLMDTVLSCVLESVRHSKVANGCPFVIESMRSGSMALSNCTESPISGLSKPSERISFPDNQRARYTKRAGAPIKPSSTRETSRLFLVIAEADMSDLSPVAETL